MVIVAVTVGHRKDVYDGGNGGAVGPLKKADSLWGDERELLMLNLAELREQYNVKQADIKGFSQPAISRIEGRMSSPMIKCRNSPI